MAKNSDIIPQSYINLTDAVEKYQDNWTAAAATTTTTSDDKIKRGV